MNVLLCPCGGQRQVVAFITEVRTVRKILEYLELPAKPLPWASAQAPPQADWGGLTKRPPPTAAPG